MKVAKLVPLALLLAAISLPAQNAPVTAPSAADLNLLLAQLDQISQTANLDLAKLRVEKWKADNNAKQQLQSNADLLARNLQGTLPGLIATVRGTPDNLTANFKLYRNVDALYDVLSSLADSAGHYAPSGDYQTLAADSSNLGTIRHALADRVEALAGYKDAQLARMTTPMVPKGTAPSKKIVIDDTAPAKSTHKKKATKTTTSNTNPQ
jgi:hypothetical protein